MEKCPSILISSQKKSKIMWSAVGNLASIVTIFGFVITIWQLFALKKSVKKSEQAIREVLDDKECEKTKTYFRSHGKSAQ